MKIKILVIVEDIVNYANKFEFMWENKFSKTINNENEIVYQIPFCEVTIKNTFSLVDLHNSHLYHLVVVKNRQPQEVMNRIRAVCRLSNIIYSYQD